MYTPYDVAHTPWGWKVSIKNSNDKPSPWHASNSQTPSLNSEGGWGGGVFPTLPHPPPAHSGCGFLTTQQIILGSSQICPTLGKAIQGTHFTADDCAFTASKRSCRLPVAFSNSRGKRQHFKEWGKGFERDRKKIS